MTEQRAFNYVVIHGTPIAIRAKRLELAVLRPGGVVVEVYEFEQSRPDGKWSAKFIGTTDYKLELHGEPVEALD